MRDSKASLRQKCRVGRLGSRAGPTTETGGTLPIQYAADQSLLRLLQQADRGTEDLVPAPCVPVSGGQLRRA